jgi:Proteolipid membrane potential modulator
VDSLINICLCALGYLPGLIHAWYIISSYPDQYERIPDDESHVHVFYHRQNGAGGAGHPPPSAGPPPGGHSSPAAPGAGTYGTISSQPQPRELPSSSSQAPAGSSAQGAKAASSTTPGAAKLASADLPSGSVQDAGPAEESSDGLPPPSYADAVRGNNKIQSHA